MVSYYEHSNHKYGQATTDYELFDIGLPETEKVRNKPFMDDLATKILGAGILILLVTCIKLTHESKPKEVPLLSKWMSPRHLPSPEKLKTICSRYNVKTRHGAAECETACSSARCCHSTCWSDNKSSCSTYHHYCSILDGVDHVTGDPHDFLPVSYQSRWFGVAEDRMDHNEESSSKATETPRNIFARGKNKEKTIDPCNSLETKQGMRSCLRHCMRGACCFMSESHKHKAEQCASVIGKTVTCADYQHCTALFH